MAVEVDDTDWAVLAETLISISMVISMGLAALPVDRAQQRKCNRVVTSKRDQAGKRLALLRWSRLISIGVWSSAQ
jgi:hypothetical protein